MQREDARMEGEVRCPHPLFSVPEMLQIIMEHYVVHLVHERAPQPDTFDGSTYDFDYRKAAHDIREDVSQIRTVCKDWLALVSWRDVLFRTAYVDVESMAYRIPQIVVTVATSDRFTFPVHLRAFLPNHRAYTTDAFRYFYGPFRPFSEKQAPLTDEERFRTLYYTNPSTFEQYSIFTEKVSLFDVPLGRLYVTGHVHPRDRFNIEVPDGAPSYAIGEFSCGGGMCMCPPETPETPEAPEAPEARLRTLRVLTFRDEECNYSATCQPLAYLILPHSSSYNERIIEHVLESHYSLDDDVVVHVDAGRRGLPEEMLGYHQGADNVRFNRCCHIPITRYEEYCDCCSCDSLFEARNHVQIG